MSLEIYLRSKYQHACGIQRSIEHDTKMVRALENRSANEQQIKDWMLQYKLFQGITKDAREAISRTFVQFAKTHARVNLSDEGETEKVYRELLTKLVNVEKRSWASATSKLLWCLYPEHFVIYDAFVYRTLVVLQCTDPALAETDRIGKAPPIKPESTDDDIEDLVRFYMRYQGLVRTLLTEHAKTLADLRKRHGETYPYDVRIMDKILWMIGDASKTY